MGRAPCCDKANVKKGPWSPEEDSKLKEYIEKNGTGGNWIALPQKAGLKRCGKSCRLRWLNYLRPNIKHGEFSAEEDRIICSLFANIGSRWSIIAAQLPGRTDNDIKNYWNTKLKKKLLAMAPPPQQQEHLPQRPTKHSLFTSSHQATPHPLLPSHSSLISSLYKDCAVGSYSSLLNTGFESISSTPNHLSNTCSSLFQTREGLAMQYYHPAKDNNSNSNMLVFGSRDQQASCSSNSDGSCSQMSYGFREIKQEEMGFHQQGYVTTGFEENHKFMLSNYDNSNNNGGGGGESLNQFWTEKTNCYFEEAPPTTTLEYDHHQIEDVKQYINGSSSSTGNCNNNNNNLFIDENKTQQEKLMYYYNF